MVTVAVSTIFTTSRSGVPLACSETELLSVSFQCALILHCSPVLHLMRRKSVKLSRNILLTSASDVSCCRGKRGALDTLGCLTDVTAVQVAEVIASRVSPNEEPARLVPDLLHLSECWWLLLVVLLYSSSVVWELLIDVGPRIPRPSHHHCYFLT